MASSRAENHSAAMAPIWCAALGTMVHQESSGASEKSLAIQEALEHLRVIPAPLDRTNLVITLQPMETMKLQSGGGVDIVHSELLAPTAIQEH